MAGAEVDHGLTSVSTADPTSHDADRIAMRAFAAIAGSLTNAPEDGRDLDDVLHVIAAQVATLIGAPRVSLYLREEHTGLYRGQVIHGAEDNLVKRLIGGVEADRFTRQIVETRAPVTLSDAMTDSRAISSTMREWGVRSVMGVPMVLNDEVIGILFADSKDRQRVFTAADEEVVTGFASLAALAVFNAQLLSKLHRTYSALAHQNKALKTAAVVENRLTKLVIDGCNLREIAESLARILTTPCAIHGPADERVALGLPTNTRWHLPADILTEYIGPHHSAGQPFTDTTRRLVTVGPFADRGFHHRILLAPVLAKGERLGTIVVMETAKKLSDLEVLVAGRAANIVALEFVARRRVIAAEIDRRGFLAAQLIAGVPDPTTLEGQAAATGTRLDVARVICLLRLPDGPTTLDTRTIVERVSLAAPGLDVLATGISEGVAVCLELPAAPTPAAADRLVKDIITDACRELPVVAAISEACPDPAAYPAAYLVSQQTLRCALRFCPLGTNPTVVSSLDLGAARLFLADVDPVEAIAFANQACSALSDEILSTVQVYIRHSSIRKTALCLGVHENTIRYRLHRAEELIGTAFTTDLEGMLRVQLAVKILELRGARGLQTAQ